MNRKLWSYNAQAKAVEDADNTLVMYGDDISDKLLHEVVNMWNGNEDLKQIQKMLDNSPLCTTEESDYVMEQIQNYEKQLSTVEETIMKPVQGNVINKTEDSSTLKPAADVGSPVKKERKQRQVTAVKTSTSKSISADELLVKMKEQIRCIEHILTISVEIDVEGLSKAARDIMIGIQKEIETVKQMAIVAIQQL